MIYICLVRTSKLQELESAIAHIPEWWIVEINRSSVAGIPISIVALRATEPPPPELSIPILQTLPEPRVCPHCLKEGRINVLPPQNKRGKCINHRQKK